MSKAVQALHYLQATGQLQGIGLNMISEVVGMLQRDITLEEAKALYDKAENCKNPKEFLKDVKTEPFALKIDLDSVDAND